MCSSERGQELTPHEPTPWEDLFLHLPGSCRILDNSDFMAKLRVELAYCGCGGIWVFLVTRNDVGTPLCHMSVVEDAQAVVNFLRHIGKEEGADWMAALLHGHAWEDVPTGQLQAEATSNREGRTNIHAGEVETVAGTDMAMIRIGFASAREGMPNFVQPLVPEAVGIRVYDGPDDPSLPPGVREMLTGEGEGDAEEDQQDPPQRPVVERGRIHRRPTHARRGDAARRALRGRWRQSDDDVPN